jgi:hypothetical protein
VVVRRVLPFLLLSVLTLGTVGAAFLGATSKSTPSPGPGAAGSCQVVTAHQAAALLGGPVSGPHVTPFYNPICVFIRGGERLVIQTVLKPVVLREVRSVINRHHALTCAEVNSPPNCRVPTIHITDIDGHVVAWLGAGKYPKESGLGFTIIGNAVLQTSAIDVPNIKDVVLGSMKDVLAGYR